ncbi:type II secretion system protein GspL [Alkalisalibacterium limincola]|uniref:type II secretion system protein GspL n=1 Tax=Alkalisalibacterium limincola TaxID=2699169 RepID=UPI0021051DE8|nr:type II secretion system protein GspL [Alkalisalibacterium limincola]
MNATAAWPGSECWRGREGNCEHILAPQAHCYDRADARPTPENPFRRTHEWLSGPANTAGPLTVVVPAEDVLLLEVERLPGSDATLARALPYAIEEQLAVAVETQHVAWVPSQAPGKVVVGVVARTTLQGWLDALRRDGLEPDAMVPEGLLVPWQPGRVGLLVEGGRAVARLGRSRVFCGRTEEVLALVSGDTSLVDRVDVDTSPGAIRAIDLYARTLASDPASSLNLLQGSFAPRNRHAGLRRTWTIAGATAVLAVLLATTHLGIERSKLAAQVDAQRAEMTALYRQLVPGNDPVASPEAYLASALRAAGQGEDPLIATLGNLSAALAREGCCTIQSLDYRNRALDAVVDAPDVAALDALRARLAGDGMRVELVGATPGSRGVEGRLRLGGEAR